MYRCLKNAQIVAQSRAKSRARNALRAAQLEPHIISPQADPIRPVYIRANRKTWRDYPPRLSRDDFLSLFTYLQRNRSQHLCTPRERAGQPGPRAENRMTKRTPWACDRIAMLAEAAESESVQLRALRSIFSDVMAVAKFSNLEHRVAEIEEDDCEEPGHPDHVA